MKRCLACQNNFDATDWVCPHCGVSPTRRTEFLAFAPDLAEQNDGFNPKIFQLMAAVEPTHFWFVVRNRILTGIMRKYFPDSGKYLEIGCGTGFVLSAVRTTFPLAHLSGSDIFTEGLVFTSERVSDAFLFQMNACHIPFFEEFDLIGAFDVLEHIDQDEAALAQIFQACKPGGGMILTVPQHRWLWSDADDFAHHKRRYTRTELVEKVMRAGFQIEYQTSFVSLLLPLMLASRLLRKFGSGMNEQMEGVGLKIGKLTNAVLRLIMQMEWQLIKVGLSFPFGGSLLLVARKQPIQKNNL